MYQLLKGVRVIEMARYIAGPFCGCLLADMGAEVIKLEKAGRGDESRDLAPLHDENRTSVYFPTYNRNKKSVEIEFRDPKGLQMVKDLIANADVFVTNFRPSALEAMGLTYEKIKEINPSIIMLSISGYGLTGPKSTRAAFDAAVSYGSGYWIEANGEPTHGPRNPTDHFTALYGAISVLSALNHKNTTGEGTFIELPMVCCCLSMLNMNFAYCRETGEPDMPAEGSPVGIVKLKDGKLSISSGSDPTFARIRDCIGGMLLDPKYADVQARIDDRPKMMQAIEDRLNEMDLTAQEAEEMFAKLGIPSGKLRAFHEVMKDEQIAHLNHFVPVEVPGYGEILYGRYPGRFSALDYQPEARVCTLGEHNKQVAKDVLGYTDEQIAELAWMK